MKTEDCVLRNIKLERFMPRHGGVDSAQDAAAQAVGNGDVASWPLADVGQPTGEPRFGPFEALAIRRAEEPIEPAGAGAGARADAFDFIVRQSVPGADAHFAKPVVEHNLPVKPSYILNELP
jgi:hypothetical protein